MNMPAANVLGLDAAHAIEAAVVAHGRFWSL
jgi:hypothetical protein